jgi:hypothetical protein
MKVITKPFVHLMSDQNFHPHPWPEYQIPEDGDDATKIGSFAAKVCYRSFGDKGRSNTDNQTNIIQSMHGRVLEHVVFGLHIIGISRGLGNELITHKHVVVSQESTRWCDMEGEGAAFVLEPWMAAIYEQYPEHCDLASRGRANASWGPELGEQTLRRIGIVAEQLRSARQGFESYGRQVREY